MNSITPISKKILCQHRNGDTFAVNPTTDFVPYVQGNVIEKLKVVSKYDIQTVTKADTTTLIKAETSGAYVKLTHPYSNWAAEGFAETEGVHVTHAGNSTNGTVSVLVGNEMYLTAASFFSNLGIIDGDFQDDLNIYNTTQPTALRFMFGLIPVNSIQATTAQYGSLLNGEDQLYTGSGFSGSPTTLSYNANPATDLGSVDVTYSGSSGPGNSLFSFQIDHIFRIPHFIEPWLTNYLNSSIPSQFQGNATYKYVTYMNFCTNLNNPNQGRIYEDALQDSSIGFVGQNFNTGATDYALSAVQIDIGGTVVTKPEVTDTNTFTVTISRTSGNFAAGVKAYLYVSKLPVESEYTDAANNYETNFVLDQLDVLEGAGPSSGTIIKNLDVNIDGGDPQLLDIDFDIEWTAAQQLLLSTNDNIFVGVIVEDGTKTASLSDRTPVEIYAGQVTKNNDISGLITLPQIDIFSSTQDPLTDTPTSDVVTWDNRAYYLDGSFRVTKEANSYDPVTGQDTTWLSSFSVSVIARKPSTDTYFLIDTYVFPTGNNSKVPGTIVNIDGTGYQSFAVVTTRPLGHIPSSATMRSVQLKSVIPGVFQNYQEFTWNLGIEIPHREWIFNQDVDPIFYDSNIPDEFYGLNQKTSNFSNVNGYEIFVIATAVIYKDGQATTYHMSSDQSTVADFDVDILTTGWSAVTKYYDILGNEINVPYEGEDCRVEITITHPASAAINAGGEIVFEYTGESGQTHRLSTTKDWSGTPNALKGLVADETKVDLTQPTTTTTVLQCWIKGEFLFDGIEINTYGHLMTNR